MITKRIVSEVLTGKMVGSWQGAARAFRIQFVELSRSMGFESRYSAGQQARRRVRVGPGALARLRSRCVRCRFGVRAQRFPCNFASRAGIPREGGRTRRFMKIPARIRLRFTPAKALKDSVLGVT